jgi:hypothetical protein
MNIKNFDTMSVEELNQQIESGAKFVMFQYTVSVVVMTFKRPSDIYFIPAGESTAKHSWKYSLLSATLGWWGLPWGIIYTIGSLGRNIGGGKDVTQEMIAHFNQQ